MSVNKLNEILNAGASTINDILYLSKKLKLKLNYVGSIHDIDRYKININKTGNYIFLLHPKDIQSGHWICIKREKKKAYYFDSYGIVLSDYLQEKLHCPIYYNDYQIQDLRSSHCGLYCIYFLKDKNMIKKFKKIQNEREYKVLN